ncbi:MAG: hypothetical protein IANPNBLG_03090 [Bryobacteraceae bacterium]|nr:hypothetical protein [Bryobacteraceae bacterium]
MEWDFDVGEIDGRNRIHSGWIVAWGGWEVEVVVGVWLGNRRWVVTPDEGCGYSLKGRMRFHTGPPASHEKLS